MQISEDGTVTGSIDNSKLGEVKPKTDEAKAQLAQLKADADAGNAEAAANAENSIKVAQAQAEGKPVVVRPASPVVEDEKKSASQSEKSSQSDKK